MGEKAAAENEHIQLRKLKATLQGEINKPDNPPIKC